MLKKNDPRWGFEFDLDFVATHTPPESRRPAATGLQRAQL
jgi:hypothetical protein